MLWSLPNYMYLFGEQYVCVPVVLKIIDTIGKTHDTEFIFSWDAFEMCSIDLTNFHSMLTGLSDRY